MFLFWFLFCLNLNNEISHMNLDNNETKRPITLYEKMDVILTEDEINVLLIILKT